MMNIFLNENLLEGSKINLIVWIEAVVVLVQFENLWVKLDSNRSYNHVVLGRDPEMQPNM